MKKRLAYAVVYHGSAAGRHLLTRHFSLTTARAQLTHYRRVAAHLCRARYRVHRLVWEDGDYSVGEVVEGGTQNGG